MTNEKLTADVTALRDCGRSCAAIRRRELIAAYRVIDADYDSDREYNSRRAFSVVDARVYMGRSSSASTVYAIVWISGPDRDDGHDSAYGYGIGSAGGYGYDKSSAAIGEAIGEAGIQLSRSIRGVGESAVEEALLAIADALGVKRPQLVKTYS